MNHSGHILIINPGSTSTKLAVYAYDVSSNDLQVSNEVVLHHNQEQMASSGAVLEQLPLRLEALRDFLTSDDYNLELVMARSAPLKPMRGGVYEVNESMLADLRSAKYSNHASNLAALLGDEIRKEMNIPVYISDPITTDELFEVARISGVPEIQRRSRSHALNMKASTRKICVRHNIPYEKSNWVVCHLGGGISVAAMQNGALVDVNDALLGMGPFSPERAGALPISGLLDLAFSGDYDRSSLDEKLSRSSGLKGYLGTSDLKDVEKMIQDGDERAELIYDAMIYQIAKEMGAMASVHSFQLNGFILTGGMAHSQRLCLAISGRIKSVADVYVEPGENELQALAEAGLRIVRGEETIMVYSDREK